MPCGLVDEREGGHRFCAIVTGRELVGAAAMTLFEKSRPRWRVIVPIAVAMAVLGGCTLLQRATYIQNQGLSVPWWCTSTEEIPVTDGPAAGSVDYYAGTHKSPLSWDECKTMSGQIDQAEAYAVQWPTLGAAEADGWRMATTYVPGMGTHHIRGGITPAMLNSPSFNRLNPDLTSAGLDDVFDPTKPEVLQYGGLGSSARLVGFDYYVRTTTGQPPAGFPGNNDWWHIHPMICFRTSDAAMVGFNTSDSSCTGMGGINVNMSNYYMLHVWVIDDMEFTPDVFAGMMPCISNGTAIHDDPQHWCHTSRTAPGMGASAVHDMSTHDMSTMGG
jgi:hypothetical protein